MARKRIDVDGQISLFDFMARPFRIEKTVRLIELFGGIGAQAMALRDLGVPFEHYRLVELDKYAVASYNAIHGTDFRPLDVRDVTWADLGIVETWKYTYFMTYSFPCQDLSVAGKGAGMAKGSGTRSGLLWEVERLLGETLCLPQVLLMENVPQVHGKRNMPDFQMWLDFLSSKGYRNFWRDLNARDFGVAQSRVRCFCVSILGSGAYSFPAPIPLEREMPDYLEDEVDEKFYIRTEKARRLIRELVWTGRINGDGGRICVDLTTDEPRERSVCNCITAKDYNIHGRKGLGNGVVEWGVG